MYYPLIIAIEVTLIQLGGAYLRYLPFKHLLADYRRSMLLKCYLIWCLFSVISYLLILQQTGLQIIIYKMLFATGWIPFVLITIFFIRRQSAQHIFIFGMQSIYFFFLHSISITMLPLLPKHDLPWQISMQAFLYLAFFVLLLPLGKKVFIHLLPSRQFINEKAYAYYIAILPLFMISSHLSFIIDNTFHVWQELASRFLLLVCFFLMYRYTTLQAADYQQQSQMHRSNKFLSHQLHSLQNYTLLMQESQKQLSILRHDMRHQVRLLYALIEENHLPDALELIKTVDSHLEKTALHPFCQNPIINAALSIYITKAQNLGIEVQYRINLPKKLSIEENDLAILLSNLIENAVIASLKQPAERRKIDITIQTKDRQIVLAIENLYDIPLRFGSDGLPIAQAKGHGTGMISLVAFIEKYHAFCSFTQENGLVTMNMYWSTTSNPLPTT